MSAPGAAAGTHPLRAFLLGGPPPDDAALLRRAHLAAYACTVVPAEHPLRRALHAELASQTSRHAAIVSEIAPLLHAWHDAGIDALLFKGLHLSAYIYPVPGTRYHGDVDLLVHPTDVERAIAIARALRWTVGDGDRRGNGHNAATLFRRGGATAVDLHRWIVRGPQRDNRRARALTAAVWRDSSIASLGGAPVRVPHPVDALLAGLVVQRAWSDGWTLKHHDAIDFRLLLERIAGGRAALLRRADALGCARTVRLFLARCDPARGVLALDAPRPLARVTLDLAVLAESGTVKWARRLEPLRLLRAGVRALRVAPDVLAAHRALRAHRSPHRVLAAAEPLHRTHVVRREDADAAPVDVARVIRLLRWLRPALRQQDTACLLHALALHRVLRRRGRAVQLVTGVRREGGAIRGHAWLELDGEVFPPARAPMPYREILRGRATRGDTAPLSLR